MWTNWQNPGVKVAQSWKPENDAGGQGAARPTVGPGQSRGQGSTVLDMYQVVE